MKNTASKKPWFNRIQQIVLPPVFEGEEDKTRLARLLNAFILVGLCFTILGIGLVCLLVSSFLARVIPLIILLLSQLVVYRLNRKGQVEVASFIMVGVGWLGITLSAINGGGVRAPSFIAYVIIILCTGIFLNKAWLYFFSALSIAAGLGMLLADELGFLPVAAPVNSVLVWGVEGIILLVSGALLHLSTYNIREALKQARYELVQRQKTEEKLQESEARARLALDAAQMGVWNWDIPANNLSWSEQVTSLFNLPLQSSSTTVQAFFGMLSSENRVAIEGAVERALSHKDASYEVVLQHKEGVERRWFEAKGQVFRDDNGQPIRMTGIITDITERKQAEIALRASQEQFYKVFHTTPVAMSVLDGVENRYLEINEAFTRITGYSYDEVVGHTALELGLWVEPRDRVELMSQLAAEQSVRDFEMRFRRKSGERGTGSLALDTFELDHKTSMLVAMLDITERKKAEEAMQFRLDFEKLVSSISNRFVNLRLEEVDNTIIETLQRMAEFVGVERSWGTDYIKGERYFKITHEWNATGLSPLQEVLNAERTLNFPFIHPKLLAKEIINIASVAQLPPEASVEKAIWQSIGVKSALIVPKIWRGEVVGGWGFHSIQAEKTWSGDTLNLIQFVGEILTNALVRKQTEEALRASEKQFRLLIQDLSVGVVMQGPKAEILLANTAALNLLGVTEDQLLGKTSFDPDWNVIHEDGSPFPGVDHPVPQAIATGKPVLDVIMGVYRPIQKDRVWLMVNALPDLDEDGKVRHITCTFNDITQRKRAEERLRRQTMRVEALAELSQLLAEVSQDYPKVLDTIVRQITDLVGDVCSVFLISDDGERFELVAAYSHEPESIGYFKKLMADSPQRVNEGLAGQVLMTGQPVLVSVVSPEEVLPTVKSEHQDFARRFPIYSRAMIPLKAQGKIIGGLSLSRFTPDRPYNLEDQFFLQDLADRAALAITNARLYMALEQELTERKRIEEQLRQQKDRLQSLAELSQALAEVSQDYPKVLDTVVRHIGEIIGDGCLIGLVSADQKWIELAAIYHHDSEPQRAYVELAKSTPISINEGLIGQVMQTGLPILQPVLSKEEVLASVKPQYREKAEQYLIYSRIIVPLKAQGRIIGVLTLSRYRPNCPYILEDQIFLQDLADRAALAISNARLYAALDQELTERKRAEVERETLISELEVKNAELERFTYTVSHDLKSPLITIRGFLGYLEKDALAGNIDRLRTDIRRIADATTKMQRLLDELLELSRIGRLTNPPETLAFEAVAREALALVEGQIAARGVKIEMDQNFPTLYGDRIRLVEVLQNLIDNAVKFMGKQAEPCIRLGWRTSDEDGSPVFFVKDNGIGIDLRYHEKVFNLFDKLDPRSEGTGVGLALIKRIIEVHGGRIWVESVGLGTGTTFCFKLPGKLNQAEGKE